MKKNVLLLSLLSAVTTTFGQQKIAQATQTLPQLPKESSRYLVKSPQEKTTACVDTIRYTQVKEQLIGTNTFYTLGLYTSDNEEISQTFLTGGSGFSVSGIEIFAGNDTTNGTTSVTAQVSIYSVDASYNPLTQLGTGSVTITSATANYYYVNFGTPVTVSGNYALVVKPTNTGGVLKMYINNATSGQTYDENFARFKSSYYTSSSNSWIPITSFTEIGNYNYEPIVAPIVNYSLTVNAGTDVSACDATPVNLVCSASPLSVLNSRMYNYQVFRTYFGTATYDSTYVWDTGDNSIIWSGNAIYNYTAGSYTATAYALGGFWESCTDTDTKLITVNSSPTVDAGADQTVCAGNSVTLTAGGASTYSWDNSVTDGVAFSPATTTTYTVTGTDANGCSDSDQVVVTVNALPVVSAGIDTTICGNTAITLTASGTASVYSWDNGVSDGVSFIPAATTTYTVTGTDTNGCEESAMVVVTIDSGCTASIDDLDENTLIIAPNPASEFVTIKFDSKLEHASYRLLTSEGKEVINGLVNGNSTVIMDLQQLAQGVYVLQVIDGNYGLTKKLVKR